MGKLYPNFLAGLTLTGPNEARVEIAKTKTRARSRSSLNENSSTQQHPQLDRS